MDGKFIKNVLKIAISNIFIILSGVVSGFFLPKLLGVTDYGFYKIFNLYITYGVFFDLGISNGIYLLYGGYKRAELPKETFRFYFSFFLKIQIIFAIIVTMVAIIFMDNEYKFIFVMVAAYTLVNNIATYFEKISVMIGEFNASAQRNILKSVLTIFIIFVLWVGIKFNVSVRYFQFYTVLFVIVYGILAFQYCLYYKELIFGEKDIISKQKENLKKIVLSVFVLLLADMVANLILTLDRQFVSALFDINTYSIYSFAYSMLRIVILAISAIATVLYPTLKRMSVEQMKKSYNYSLAIVGMISFGSLMLYYPLCVIVKSFLIEYIDSLVIFRILFPSITINAIISMIMISHYKALGKEKEYFYISVVILIISAIFNMGAYFVSKSPLGFSVASMLVMVLWYIVSNRKLEKTYNINTKINYIYLIVNIVIFYSISTFINNYYIGFVVNSVVFCIITYIIYTKETKEIICQLSKSINNRIKK